MFLAAYWMTVKRDDKRMKVTASPKYWTDWIFPEFTLQSDEQDNRYIRISSHFCCVKCFLTQLFQYIPSASHHLVYKFQTNGFGTVMSICARSLIQMTWGLVVSVERIEQILNINGYNRFNTNIEADTNSVNIGKTHKPVVCLILGWLWVFIQQFQLTVFG